MKRFTEQLNKKANSVKLQAAEKRELRERVVSYMEYHPLPAELKTAKTNVRQKKVAGLPQFTEAFATFKVPFSHIFKYSAAMAAIILVVVPFVAERAVPGDALYAVKVQFNEEIISTLTFDTYQKVEWETERLNRRIAEARLLAREGRLTEEAEAEVAEAVREHTTSAKKEIEELRSWDEDAATIASIALDSTLEVQSNSLREEDNIALAEDSELKIRPINLIASAIDESRAKDSESSASSSLPSYVKLMARVELNTTRIYELLKALGKLAPAEELIDVSRRAEDINRALQQTIETAQEDELVAREQLVVIVQRTQRLIVYMTELEVIKTVDIEFLIPLVLTDSEKEVNREAMVTDLEQRLAKIDVLLAGLTDLEALAKISFAQAEIITLLETTLPATQDYQTFKTVAEGAKALADDVLRLIELSSNPEMEIPIIDRPTTTASTSVIQVEENFTSTSEPTSTPTQ